MESNRKVTSVRQLELLLDFLEQHKDVALGRVRSKEAREATSRIWEECANILNSEGPFRRAKEWSKFWNDYKTRVRGKLIHNRKSQTGTGGGPSTTIVLTPIEQRAAFIIGQDVGPIPGVQQNPFQFYEMEANEILQHVQTESSSCVLDTPTQDQLRDELAPAQEVQFSLPASISAHHALSPVLASSAEHAIPTLSSHISANPRMRSRNPTARRRPPVQQSDGEALEQSRSAIVKMEVMRARTEELLALSLLKQTEAAERHGRAIEKMAQSFEVIAEALDRMSRRRRRRRVSSSDDETVLLDNIP